jgi:acyl-CoA hydrolase
MMGDYEILKPEMKGRFLNETWFYGPGDRANHSHGNVTYIPNNLHEAGRKKLANDKINIFWGTAITHGQAGFFSLSLGLTYEKMMVEAADIVVLEINENLPGHLATPMSIFLRLTIWWNTMHRSWKYPWWNPRKRSASSQLHC